MPGPQWSLVFARIVHSWKHLTTSMKLNRLTWALHMLLAITAGKQHSMEDHSSCHHLCQINLAAAGIFLLCNVPREFIRYRGSS